jgi:hypothetical protein
MAAMTARASPFTLVPKAGQRWSPNGAQIHLLSAAGDSIAILGFILTFARYKVSDSITEFPELLLPLACLNPMDNPELRDISDTISNWAADIAEN